MIKSAVELANELNTDMIEVVRECERKQSQAEQVIEEAEAYKRMKNILHQYGYTTLTSEWERVLHQALSAKSSPRISRMIDSMADQMRELQKLV
ncbi:hypothetical protein EV213_1342 [Aureibacillus halotolerans]|uniref:Uncharacterized protein n=2 Tax=Aureibacillus halotolerans TaxID=1508390 RepID=A0A4R6TQK3_9BACI|nr:hypothetical protein EV213_1342 [Aureibacillus halotolerans]